MSTATTETIVEGRTFVTNEPDELPCLKRAMEIGNLPMADTRPRVFLCGECRAVVISEGQGVCKRCHAMLAKREQSDDDGQKLLLILLVIFVICAVVWLMGQWISKGSEKVGAKPAAASRVLRR
jgi:uncharacterized paraquat-inducible protein A